ncbi:MAG: hypothetical protein NWF01_10700 [Candidatus Bathyarchaeota archaeon]|nr:hypothetical protein [Candidatus Bathyarchaeota archaeon]
MSTELELNVALILHYLRESNTYVTGNDIQLATGLEPFRINHAVAFLKDDHLIESIQSYDIPPFIFHSVKLTAKGNEEIERKRWQRILKPLEKKHEPYATNVSTIERPVGSPFGFTDNDWRAISVWKKRKNILYVVFGCKFASDYCNYSELGKNIKKLFKESVARYNKENHEDIVELKYSSLHAGYGEHLFNEIAREIISSDIAVFETSDMAPNVFIEIGVALTWGSSVLLIKNAKCPIPPSDISGQTYADYSDNGKKFADSDYSEKIYRMVEKAVRKKC